MADAEGVDSRATVLRFERVCERGDGLAVCVLNHTPLPAFELDELAKVASKQQNLLARLAFELGGDLDGVGARQTVDHADELEWAERLAQERIRPRVSGCCLGDFRAGQKDDERRSEGRLRLQVGAEGESVDASRASAASATSNSAVRVVSSSMRRAGSSSTMRIRGDLSISVSRPTSDDSGINVWGAAARARAERWTNRATTRVSATATTVQVSSPSMSHVSQLGMCPVPPLAAAASS